MVGLLQAHQQATIVKKPPFCYHKVLTEVDQNYKYGWGSCEKIMLEEKGYQVVKATL